MADSLSYQHVVTELRVYHGGDSLASLKRELERAGVRRAVVVCGNTVSRGEPLARLRERLGNTIAAVTPTARENSPLASVEETARIITETGGDAIIAIGGGSAAVTSRAAAVLVGEKKPMQELCTRRLPDGKFDSPRLNAPKLPQFVIPTTPSTAFAKAGCAVHDAQGQRLAMFDPKTRAKAIFIDPEFVGTAPPELARNAGLNALSNAVEALESPKCDPISEAFLMQALRMLHTQLPALQQQGTAAREHLVVAAILCGRGTEHGGAGLASVLAHAIGHRVHVANGIVGVIVLPHTMKYNSPVTRERSGTVLEALGAPRGSDAGEAVTKFLRELGAPTRLRDIDVSKDDLKPIADAAMLDWFISRNARSVPNAAALMELLEGAW